MAINVIFDSGIGGVPADVWGGYFPTTRVFPLPREILIAVLPLSEPRASWNLAGYAAVRSADAGTYFFSESTAVPVFQASFGTTYTVMNVAGMNRSGGALEQVHGVQWNLNRWIGQSRVIVAVRTV